MDIEWALVFFTLFTGLSAGTFLGVAASEWSGTGAAIRLPATVLSLAALALGGFASILHLGHPERIFGALGHPTSGIFLEAVLIGVFGLGAFAYIMASRRKAPDASRKIIAYATGIPALLLAFAVGYTYVMPSRPAWNTVMLPLLYVASAAVMGCFSIRLLHARTGKNAPAPALRRTALAALALQALLTAVYIAVLTVAPHADPTRSAGRVLTGSLSPLFWIGVVLAGLLIPAMTLRRPRSAESCAAAAFGLLCVFVGGAAFRAMMFALGSSVRSFF